MKLTPFVALVASLPFVSGCAGSSVSTRFSPKAAAPPELTLRYDGHLELWSDGKRVAKGRDYTGLTDFVGCVPAAQRHARAAEAAGRDAKVYSTVAGILALGGLASVGGLAVEDTRTKAAILGTGVVVELIAVLFAGGSRDLRLEADGNAVDAMNFYNDAAGSVGKGCRP